MERGYQDMCTDFPRKREWVHTDSFDNQVGLWQFTIGSSPRASYMLNPPPPKQSCLSLHVRWLLLWSWDFVRIYNTNNCGWFVSFTMGFGLCVVFFIISELIHLIFFNLFTQKYSQLVLLLLKIDPLNLFMFKNDSTSPCIFNRD